ncbi:uncharacterized protein LOC143021946 isoform X2 [Oratosquilla oratoria]|uniref:uncharacterized protein LOC143021946 isoform X2 n=1 Tax=Oratosquilla oratoria TaxID=337810 RepID=UPI003F76A3D4
MKVKTLHTADGYSTVASRAKLSVQVEQRKRLGGWAKRVLVLDGTILYAYKTKGEGGSVSGWAVGGAEVAVSGSSPEGREDGRHMLTISRQHAYKITFALTSVYEQARLIQALSSSGATVIGLEAILLLQDLRKQQEEEQERERKGREEGEDGEGGTGGGGEEGNPKIASNEEDLFNVRWTFFEDGKIPNDSLQDPPGNDEENAGSRDKASKKKKKTKAVRRHSSDSSSSGGSRRLPPKSSSVFYNSSSGLAYNPLYSSALSLTPSGDDETSSSSVVLRRSNTLSPKRHSLNSLSTTSVSSLAPSSPSSETPPPRLSRSISLEAVAYKINPIPKPPRTGLQGGNPSSASSVVSPIVTPAYEANEQVEALGAQGHSPSSSCPVKGRSSALTKGPGRSEVTEQKEGELPEEGDTVVEEEVERDTSFIVNVAQVTHRIPGEVFELNRKKFETVKERGVRLPPEGAENAPGPGHQFESDPRRDWTRPSTPWAKSSSREREISDQERGPKKEQWSLITHTLELPEDQASLPSSSSSRKKEITKNYVKPEGNVYRTKETSVCKEEEGAVNIRNSVVNEEEEVGECEDKDDIYEGGRVRIEAEGLCEEVTDLYKIKEKIFRKKNSSFQDRGQCDFENKQEFVTEEEEEIVCDKETVVCQDEVETPKAKNERVGRRDHLKLIRQRIIAPKAETPKDGYPMKERPSDEASLKRHTEGKPENFTQRVIDSKVEATDIIHESGEVLRSDEGVGEVGGGETMRLERGTALDKGSLRLLTSTDKDGQKLQEDGTHHVLGSNALPKGGGYSPPPPLFSAKEIKHKQEVEDNGEALPSPRSSGKDARPRVPCNEVSRIVKTPKSLEDRIHLFGGQGVPEKEDSTKDKPKLSKLPFLRRVREELVKVPSEGADEEANGHQAQDLRHVEGKSLENGSSSKPEDEKLKTSGAPEEHKKKFSLFGFMSKKTKEKKTSRVSPSSSRASSSSPPSSSASPSSLSEEEDDGSFPGNGRSLKGVNQSKTSDIASPASETQPFSLLSGASKEASIVDDKPSHPMTTSEGKTLVSLKEEPSEVEQGMSEETPKVAAVRAPMASSSSPRSLPVRRQISVDESSPIVISGHIEMSGSLGGKWNPRRIDVRGGHVLAYPGGAIAPTTRISLKALSVVPALQGPTASKHALCITRGNRCMIALKFSSNADMTSWLHALSDEVIRVTPEDQIGSLTLHPSPSHRDSPLVLDLEDHRSLEASSAPATSEPTPISSDPAPPEGKESKPRRSPPKTLPLVKKLSKSADPSPSTSPVFSPSEGFSVKSSSCVTSPVGKTPSFLQGWNATRPQPEAREAPTQQAGKPSMFHIPAFRKPKSQPLTASSAKKKPAGVSVQAGDAEEEDQHVTREGKRAAESSYSRRPSDSANQTRAGSTCVRDAVNDIERKNMQKPGDADVGGAGDGGGGKDGSVKWPSGLHAIEESIRNKINQFQSAVKEGVQAKKDIPSFGSSLPRKLRLPSDGSFPPNSSSVFSSPPSSMPCRPPVDGALPVFPSGGGVLASLPGVENREVERQQHKPLRRLSGHGRRRSSEGLREKIANFTNNTEGQPGGGGGVGGVGNRFIDEAFKTRAGGGEEAGEERASLSSGSGSPTGHHSGDPTFQPRQRASRAGHTLLTRTSLSSSVEEPVTHNAPGSHEESHGAPSLRRTKGTLPSFRSSRSGISSKGENPHPRLQRQFSITAELNEGDAGIAKITWSVAAVRERFESLSRESEHRRSRLTRQNSGLRRSGRGSIRKQRSTEGVVKRASIKRSGKRIDVSIRPPSSTKKLDKNLEEIRLKSVRERMRPFETNQLLKSKKPETSSTKTTSGSFERRNSDSESSDPGIITSRSVNARPESICDVPPSEASTEERHLLSPVSECSAVSSEESNRENVILCWKGPYISQETEQMVLTNISNAFLAKRRLQAKEVLLVHLRERLGEVEENIWDLQARMGELDNARACETKDSNAKLNSEYSDLEKALRTAEQEATAWNTRISRAQSSIAESRLKLAAALQAGLAQWSSTEDRGSLRGSFRRAKRSSRRFSGHYLQEIHEQQKPPPEKEASGTQQKPCPEKEASGTRKSSVESIENR